MDIECHFGEGAQSFDYGRAETNIGDKVAVHDVQVQPFSAGAADPEDFRPQAREIGGQ
jgi:hypothetical protein